MIIAKISYNFYLVYYFRLNRVELISYFSHDRSERDNGKPMFQRNEMEMDILHRGQYH